MTKIVSVKNITHFHIVKNISIEEKKKFLEGKLTEEEIAEVMRRLNNNESGNVIAI